MHENKAYFRIYGEKVRAKSRVPKQRSKNTPEWFNYQMDELSELNSIKNYLNIGKISISLKNNKEGFIKNIKKTKAQQIKYLLEDMDEEVRRLKNAVLYVGFCNRQLKMVLKNEERFLEVRMNGLEKILKQSIKEEEREQAKRKERSRSRGQHGVHNEPKSTSPNLSNKKNYMISNHVSDNTDRGEEEYYNKNLVIDDFSETVVGPREVEKPKLEKNYLLRQLQRQLLEMNNKLKSLKMELGEHKEKENYKELVEIKGKLKQQKCQKKNNMLDLHKVNEKFLEKRIKKSKVEGLRKR